MSTLTGTVATEPGLVGSKTKQMQNFLQANDYISKFVFVILIVIVFIALYHLGVFLIRFLFGPKKNVYLTNSMNDGTKYLTIPQDPHNNSSITVNRSVNQKDGIAFTWSIWLYIKPQTSINNLLHVFHKGNNNFSKETIDNSNWESGMNWPNNAPGLYININEPGYDSSMNMYNNPQYQLLVVMNTFTDIVETITVPDIPLNKWVNVMIRCEQTAVDVYINGSVVKRQELGDVPKQNYGDVYVSANGGFNGYTSQLRYFGSALQPGEIVNIVNSGPSTKSMSSVTPTSNKNNWNPYLSMRWYLDDNQMSGVS